MVSGQGSRGETDELGVLDGLLRSRLDPRAVEKLRSLLNPLKGLFNQIQHNRARLTSIDERIDGEFSADDLSSFENPSFRFLSEIHDLVGDLVSKTIFGYFQLESKYKISVDGVNFEEVAYTMPSRSTMLAMAAIPELLQESHDLFVSTNEKVPATLKAVHEGLSKHGKYLRARFVKSDTATKNGGGAKSRFRMPDLDEMLASLYVKVELVDSNPVLTDVLLGLIDTIPEYQERTISGKVKGRSKKVRDVSEYAVNNSMVYLTALSDPHLLPYLQNPKLFFEHLGGALKDFYTLFKEKLEPEHRKFTELDEIKVVANARAKRKLFGEEGKVIRDIERLARADFEAISQKPEEYLPDNKKEKDYFRARKELMGLLYSTVIELSGLHGQEEAQEKLAREVVLRAVDLKAQMLEIMTPQATRRLREDRRTDNEYYEGYQGEIGSFAFKREPTPRVKMDEVIGASFDQAKTHLKDIIETGSYGNVMRLSAPGGKVRSNILLIGPYGCGKTELARATCGDQRVIGASVSVRNILTAWMHESVGNVGRVYDAARELYRASMSQKPVVLVLDEFDGWFERDENGGTHADVDVKQMETVLLQILDGMGDYNGIITMAMTNKPSVIPKGIIRRFRYVDIVGQLTEKERADMLKMYVEKTLPIREGEMTPEHYTAWAKKLENAPGDVVRKVVDEIHFSLLPEYIRTHPREAARLEGVLRRREISQGELKEGDINYLKARLGRDFVVTPEKVDGTIDYLLKQPPIRMQIDTARKLYREAEELLAEISTGSPAFGLQRRREIFR